MNKNKSL